MMMIQHMPGGLPETPYMAIARSASHAPPRRLLLVLAGAVAVLALAAQLAGRWPLLALAIGSAAAAVESAALWGFLAQAEERHHSLVLVVLERLFAVVGTALACAAVIATMLALLGRPWVL
jgi:hypothetical protein